MLSLSLSDIHTYIHRDIHTNIHTCECVYVYIHVCIHSCIHTIQVHTIWGLPPPHLSPMYPCQSVQVRCEGWPTCGSRGGPCSSSSCSWSCSPPGRFCWWPSLLWWSRRTRFNNPLIIVRKYSPPPVRHTGRSYSGDTHVRRCVSLTDYWRTNTHSLFSDMMHLLCRPCVTTPW